MIIYIRDYGYVVSNIDDVNSNNNYYYKSRAKSLIIIIIIVMSPLQLMSSALQQYTCSPTSSIAMSAKIKLI